MWYVNGPAHGILVFISYRSYYCIATRWPDKRCLSQACTFIRSSWRCTFKWRRQWHFIDTKIDNYVLIASLNSESASILINRILEVSSTMRIKIGTRTTSASERLHCWTRLRVESFDIKFTTHSFENACWIAGQASRCQQAFSKPCLVNLISCILYISHMRKCLKETAMLTYPAKQHV